MKNKIFFLFLSLVFNTSCAFSAATLSKVNVSEITDPAKIQAARTTLFNTKCTNTWETCFEGNDLPGQGAEPFRLWANPVDDDWKTAEFRTKAFKINQVYNKRTYLSVDRTVFPDDQPGWLMLQDKNISSSTGVLIHLGIRIPKISEKNAVKLLYGDLSNKFAVYFNNDSITFSPSSSLTPHANDISYKLDLSKDFAEFLIQKDPKNSKISIYQITSTSTNLILGPASSSAQTGTVADFGNPITSILIGDADHTVKGAYDLDFIRVKRKVIQQVIPQPLPVVETATTTLMVKDTSKKTGGTLALPDILGSFNQNLSFEWKMKFKNADTNGFHVSYLGDMASYSVVVRTDGLQAKTFAKPVGSKLYVPRGYNPYTWNCYRFVKQAGNNFGQLYVNNLKTPILMDIGAGSSGKQPPYSLVYGRNTVPESPYVAWKNSTSTIPGLGAYLNPNIELEYIGAADSAFAPGNSFCK